MRNGFRTERLQLPRALDEQTGAAEIERVVAIAATALRNGQSVLVFSAEGPDDAMVAGFDGIARTAGLARSAAARRVGIEPCRGDAQAARPRASCERVVVAGGDSSGEVASALDIQALTVAAGMAPGAPLCRAWSTRRAATGCEIVLKGGQIGMPSFFGSVREGRTGA